MNALWLLVVRPGHAAAGVELDVPERMHAVLASSGVPRRVAGIVATEFSILYYALAAWRRAPFTPTRFRAFSYHRRNGLLAILYTVLATAVIELVALEFLLRALPRSRQRLSRRRRVRGPLDSRIRPGRSAAADPCHRRRSAHSRRTAVVIGRPAIGDRGSGCRSGKSPRQTHPRIPARDDGPAECAANPDSAAGRHRRVRNDADGYTRRLLRGRSEHFLTCSRAGTSVRLRHSV